MHANTDLRASAGYGKAAGYLATRQRGYPAMSAATVNTLTLVHAPAQNCKALFMDDRLVVWADPAQDDPLYLIDEAAAHLAASFGVAITYRTGDLSHLLN